MKENYSATQRALWLLSKRSVTEKELRDYLEKKECDTDDILLAVEKMKDYGYVDDEAYVQNFLTFHTHKKGVHRIIFELKEKGISEELLESLDLQDDLQQLEELATRYILGKEKDFKNKTKLYRYLMSRGYLRENIESITEKLWNTTR